MARVAKRYGITILTRIHIVEHVQTQLTPGNYIVLRLLANMKDSNLDT